ncbi:hypothetical protein [Cellulomonas pakistanensis]|uniref:DUF559 domain-containing protein n=1 Tax=Cellulomonas pakistanensis TaxID=992287 RepID=A0A919P5P8_9CELL|nr:hypothetical protein [Cellulomonas pakistanensis]GIG34814.1 hypothetical protein Cpa01nite_01950 [Cellulomonas pakistanensis]
MVRAGDLPADELRARVRRLELIRVTRGIYVPPSTDVRPWVVEQHRLLSRAAAVHALRSGPHWFSHGTAAVLWGCVLTTIPAVVDVTSTVRRRSGGRGPGGVRDHLFIDPPGPAHVSGHLALPVTSLARTLVDCASSLPPADGLAVADSGMRAGADPAEVRRILDARAGCRGVRRARRVLELADPRADSAGESRLRWVLASSDLPRPDLQVGVSTRLGWRWVDLGWNEVRLAVEFDGRVKYGTAQQEAAAAFMAEKRRQEAVEEEGWVVVRVTWADLDHPAEVLARVRRAWRRVERR